MVHPKSSGWPPAPIEVPPDIAADYSESCLVLADSPKASAALSRRCLQHLLVDAAGAKGKVLDQDITDAIDKGLPSHIAESIDAVRNIGNFAAHPSKSTATGEIIEVEPGEAEWNLEVLQTLFDFYYVGPAKTKAKRAALDKKLAAAGKQPMK